MLSLIHTDELHHLPRRPFTKTVGQSCGLSKTLGRKIVNQCVHCHMPTEETNVIVSQTAGQVAHATMRNHWIKVYPNMRLPETAATPPSP